MIYSVRTGRCDADSKVTLIDCDSDDEAMSVGYSIYLGEKTKYSQPIACVIKRGEGVSFRNLDIVVIDCM